jgi:hypothetical protein
VKSYAERQVFPDIAKAVWADAVSLIQRVSSRHGNEVRCHELARAAQKALFDLNEHRLRVNNAALTLADGKLWAIEHSWLYCEWRDAATPRRCILDVYCPGRMPQVQLIADHFAVSRGYEASNEERPDIDRDMVLRLIRKMQS